MRALTACILSACCFGAAHAETGRLFFDTLGNGGNQHAAHPGGLAMTNPLVCCGGGRLYVYWQFGRPGGNDSQNVLGLNFNVTVDDGTITEAMNYQPTINVISQPRWQDAPGNPAPNPAINPGSNQARFTAININRFGLKNDPAAVALDQGYDQATNTTILGYVDIDVFFNTSVWITVDTLGIAIQGGSPADQIYMGFGDGPVPAGGSPGTRTSIAEAVVPEPATLALLGLGAAGLWGTRRSARAMLIGDSPTQERLR